MWLPSLMEKMEQNAGSPCDPKPINVTVKTGNNSTDMYVDVFIGAAAQLPANIFTIAFIDRFGGKIVVCKYLCCVFEFSPEFDLKFFLIARRF